MSGRAWRGAGLAVGLALVAALSILPSDPGDAALTFGILAPVGLATVAAGELLAARRRRVVSLRRQAGLVGLLSAAQVAVSAGLFIAAMFLSAHDGWLTLILVVDAAALAAWSARLIGAGVMADLEAIRNALAAVSAGRRDVRAEVAGTDDIARLGADVDAMIDRLAGEEQARRELITAVSHDLRTPITALRLLAEAIDDGIVDDATRRRYAARMTTHVRALGALIDDLLELAQLQRGELDVEREPVDLVLLAGEAVEAMRPAADERRIALRAAPAERPAPAHVSPEKVQRVLFNLLENAIRHTAPGGAVDVTVDAAPDPEGIEIVVADTGEGIAPADRPRVFEPFFRGGADAARTDPGAGLGLAISRAIVEAHSGSIELGDSARGTRVIVRLPRDRRAPP